ncbi:MAG: Crp/Fnr family transcriptional regulator [Saprospiraceae bacterium]|nr:Crp/Fnr family transcriptional regulator [Saprospiraceae bacterium]
MINNIEEINCVDCKYQSSCFNELVQSELEFINQKKVLVKFNKGETIYKQGTFSSNIMYIIEGFASKYIEGPNNKNLIVKILKPSEYIGLSSLFCINEHCYYSVTAITDTMVCLIKKDDFTKLVSTNNKFAQEIIKWYCKNDKGTFNKLKSISSKHMPGLLAETIIYISQEEYKEIGSSITRKNLAELAGISVESTIRILSEFKKEKIIDFDGKTVKILNKDKLLNISKKG